MQGAVNGKIPDFKKGWARDNFWSTVVLGTLEVGKHDVNNVNNVNNVQCLITVSIGEILSPGEETRAAASISVHCDTDATLNSAKIHARPTVPNKSSVRGRLQFSTNLTTS